MIFLLSQSVIQTDWSGGPGVCGPVAGGFGSSFCSGYNVEWHYPDLVRPVAAGVSYTWTERNIHPNISGHDNTGIQVVDFDGDGDMDIVASDEDYTRKLHILLNDGCAVSFADSVVDDASGVGRGFEGVVVYDFDGNGYPDIFTGGEYYPNSSWYGQTVVYMNDAPGFNFTRHYWYLGNEAEDIADPTDLLSNGHVGTVITGHSSPVKYYWYDGTTWQSYDIAANVGGVVLDMAARDLDGDGDDDVLISLNEGYQGLVVYENDYTGSGNFIRRVLDNSLADGWKYMDVEDMDGDGDYDVVLTNMGSGRVWLYTNNGAFSFTRTLIATVGQPIGVDAEDVDLDGDMDVVVAAYGDNRIYFIINTGSSWLQMASPFSRPYFAAYSKDLNGDGFPDILTKTASSSPGLWAYFTDVQFEPRAQLTSSIYEDTYQRRWLSVELRYSPCWDTVSGKRTEVYVRASRNNVTWTAWDGPYTFTSSGTLPLSSTFSSGTYKYLQYRLVMYSSSDSSITPVIDYVKFNAEGKIWRLKSGPELSEMMLLRSLMLGVVWCMRAGVQSSRPNGKGYIW